MPSFDEAAAARGGGGGGGGALGNDLAPFAVTLLAPLLDLTPAHGPTEFCLGSAHLSGVEARAKRRRRRRAAGERESGGGG